MTMKEFNSMTASDFKKLRKCNLICLCIRHGFSEKGTKRELAFRVLPWLRPPRRFWPKADS